ncbi:MAG: esterase [Chloroflexi bacterium]|nr:esterase [Chloroflexota bacterium]
MTQCITTLGPKSAADLGMILPHEHVFVDLRTDNPPGFAEADPDDVINLMGPELDRARQAGITLVVECTPVGVGRRADLLKAVSEAAQFPLLVPTGIYREPWIPDWAHHASQDELYQWMLGELQDEIEKSGVRAGCIKLSAGDEGLTVCETKILWAAAKAGRATNAVIGSHTIKGRVVRDQLDILEDARYSPERFIWIHAQAEPDFNLNLEMARRGAWIEYDWIGNPDAFDDDYYIHRIRAMLAAGLAHRVLISHDRGWYTPALPGGGTPQPFTYLTEVFLPKLRAAGIDDATIKQLTHTNPFKAFAR